MEHPAWPGPVRELGEFPNWRTDPDASGGSRPLFSSSQVTIQYHSQERPLPREDQRVPRAREPKRAVQLSPPLRTPTSDIREIQAMSFLRRSHNISRQLAGSLAHGVPRCRKYSGTLTPLPKLTASIPATRFRCHLNHHHLLPLFTGRAHHFFQHAISCWKHRRKASRAAPPSPPQGYGEVLSSCRPV